MDTCCAKAGFVECGDALATFRRHILTGFSFSVSGEAEKRTIKFSGGTSEEKVLELAGKEGGGLGDILDAALSVADNPTDKAVEGFAAEWGPLSATGINEDLVFHLEDYRRLCLYADTFLRVYAAATRGLIAKESDRFSRGDTVEEFLSRVILEGMDQSDLPEEKEQFSNMLVPVMAQLRQLLRYYLKHENIRKQDTLVWSKAENGFRLKPLAIFVSEGCGPALHMDLYRHVFANSPIFVCDRCGKIYVRDAKRPNEATKNFCRDCNVGYRTSRGANFRRWKETKDLETFFSKEGIAFEVRQVDVPYLDFRAFQVGSLAEFTDMRVGEVSLWGDGQQSYFLVASVTSGRISAKKLSAVLKEEVDRVDPGTVEKLFPGRDFGLPAFPMLKRRQYPLVVDRKLLDADKVVFSTGFRSHFLILDSKDLNGWNKVIVADL